MKLFCDKEMMHLTEKHKLIDNNQYGVRRGYQLQSAILNKALTLDIISYPHNIVQIIHDGNK